MSRYSRMFLHFMHAITNDRDRVFTFVFGTRLTNITRYLRYRDVDLALDQVGEAVADWSGGTRIGHCLAEFNRLWSRRVLGQGAIVLLITDGLDRDAGTGLAHEMDRLHRSCRRLIWLNPLLRYEGFEPKSLGMRAMMPHVDEFRPVHNLESLEDLVAALSAPVDAARPRRPRHGGLTGVSGMSDTAEILEQAARWRQAGKGVALATVVTTWGSSPRPVGAKLAVDDQGAIRRLGLGRLRRRRGHRAGARGDRATASRGCSISASATSRPGKSAWPAAARSRSLSSASNEGPDSRPGGRRRARAPLGGARHRTRRRPAIAAEPDGGGRRAPEGDLTLDAPALERVREIWRSDRNRTHRNRGRHRVFVEVLTPPHRCFIIGAVHIAQPLAQMLTLADYAVTVIDPRGAFATAARFPDVELVSEWPDEALERLQPDRGSAVVALTHDPKLDDPALAVALRSDCFYIGALGLAPQPCRASVRG